MQSWPCWLTGHHTTDADFDSPYRTGSHVPLSQSRHEPLTSVATTASESRGDVSSPFFEDSSRASLNGINAPTYPGSPMTPGARSPYSPGLRSTLNRQATSESFEVQTPGEIQLQPFQEGLPPPPPCSHSWKKIDRWAEEHYYELWEQLGEGCTNNDLNALEHQLDCSLPMEVRESLQIHDGQETGGRPTGIIFGCMLLDCEEIVHEWHNWKVVNEAYLNQPVSVKPATPLKAFGGESSSSSRPPNPSAPNPHWREDLKARQESQPPGAVQKVYAHPAWIPLARDWGGNNLAVDLAPGPTGKWGQVILFGRDYDCKYVIARSWSAFLATVADDLNSGKWFVDEETNELKLKEFKSGNVEPAYLDILRWRCDQKYGRKPPPRRRSMQPQAGATNGRASPTGANSPYASPTAEVGEPRGRSMQRFSGASPVASPNRPNYGKSSPLARVTEEGGVPIKLHTNGVSNLNGKLVEVSTPVTPRGSEDDKKSKDDEALMEPVILEDDKENKKSGDSNPTTAMTNGTSKKSIETDDSGMKTIEI